MSLLHTRKEASLDEVVLGTSICLWLRDAYETHSFLKHLVYTLL